jgi:hypothetical protein
VKKNAEAAVAYVQQALRETGSDFALSNARQYLVAALNELTKVQNKCERRERNFKMEEEARQKKRLRLEEAQWRLRKLDEMFKAEEAKLRNGSNQSGSPKT